MRARSHGLRRAAFWRALGFPNLVLARARRAELRAQRKLEKAKAALLRPFFESTRDDL
jgi:hypothetical protein